MTTTTPLTTTQITTTRAQTTITTMTATETTQRLPDWALAIVERPTTTKKVHVHTQEEKAIVPTVPESLLPNPSEEVSEQQKASQKEFDNTEEGPDTMNEVKWKTNPNFEEESDIKAEGALRSKQKQ